MFDFDAFLSYFANPYLMKGVLVTIGLTIATMFIGLVLGTILALGRMSSRGMLARLAGFYILGVSWHPAAGAVGADLHGGCRRLG